MGRLPLPSVWLLAGAILLLPALGDVTAPIGTGGPRGKGRNDPPPPSGMSEDRIPVMEPKRVRVLRGETIRIILDSVEDPPSRRVRYSIREQPQAGTLTPPEESDEDLSIATVDYTADPSAESLSDRFTFSAQYLLGRVSAPVAVDIEIIPPAAVINAPEALDFGRTVLGSVSTRSVLLTNTGTSGFSLVPPLDAPWSWLPEREDPVLRILPGESITATFAYQPAAPGRETVRLSLPTGNPGHPGILFTGEGTVPFTVQPAILGLEMDPRGRQRIGHLTVTNPGTGGTVLWVETGDARLQSWKGNRIWMDKETRQDLTFQLAPEDTGPFEGTIVLRASGFVTAVPVSAPATPGFLEITGTGSGLTLDFGPLQRNTSRSAPLTLRNTGGTPLPVRISPPAPPFRLVDPPADVLLLQPGTERRLEIVAEPTESLPFQGEIVAVTPDRELTVVLRTEGMPEPSRVEVTAGSDLRAEGSRGFQETGATGAPRAPGSLVLAPPGRTGGYNELIRKTRGQPPAATAVSPNPGGEVNPTASGRNGEIALPPMPSQDGLISHSPHRTKTDVTLAQIPFLGVERTSTGSIVLAWPRPEGPFSSFEVETRALCFNEEHQRVEGIWFPLRNVRLTVGASQVTAEVRDLKADAFYWFRVFSRGPEGTHGLPSQERGVRTQPLRISLGTVANVGFIALVLAAGTGLVLYFKHEHAG